MSKAEKQASKWYNSVKYKSDLSGTPISGYIAGYEQAEKDFMEKAKQWFMEHANIAQEIETNEDGEPLARSYINYAKARIEAAKDMFKSFKQAMSELK